MKTRVKVTLVAEEEVEIEVEHSEGDDPTDLTNDDVRRVMQLASDLANWAVNDVRKVTP